MTVPVVVSHLQSRRGTFTLGPLAFAVEAGGRLAIVGPSGSGKTTLLRCIAGLDRAAAGTITIGGTIVTDERTHTAPDRRGLGLVFQEGALWPHLTALQHLTFAAPRMTPTAARTLLEGAGIGHLADRRPASMSGGEAQRLGLLRALAPEPALLLLDEPLRSVDVHQRDALVLLVRALADERGLTTILVTHDRDEALALATDLIVLHEGQLVEQGRAEDLLVQPATAFTAAFLGGAACLPAAARGDGVETAFGNLPRPHGTAAAAELRLVLMPGDAEVTAAQNNRAGPRARVLAALPDGDGYSLRCAIGDQIVIARSTATARIGSEVQLALRCPPRLLPWHRTDSSELSS